MFPQSIDPAESNVMAETIGRLTDSYLGGTEVVDSLAVRFFPLESRAVVWVGLRSPSFENQLRAVSAFATVRECYEDELELELRFGQPVEELTASAKTQVYAHTA